MSDSSHCSTPSEDSLPLETANALIAAAISANGEVEHVPIDAALNRVLASDVSAPMAVPQHRNSAMDGYAFNHADVELAGQTQLRVAGRSLAGHPYNGVTARGGAIQIMTGAVLPDACDTVVVQEAVTRNGDTISFDANDVERGAFVRAIGDDIALDETVLRAGTRLGPAQLGVLASLGIEHVDSRPLVRVAVMSTGDELKPAGKDLHPGQIYDSNRVTLKAMISTQHALAIDIGLVADDPSSIRRALDDAAANAEIILSSGGVSVGVADHMRSVLQTEGTLDFWKIAVKPGRPLVFGRWKTAWYFGLPGNPVSAMVTFDQIVRPALSLLSGESPSLKVNLMARCDSNLKKLPGRMEFQRGILGNATDGSLTVRTTGIQDSHVLTSLSDANCLIALPLESDGAAVGDKVNVIPTGVTWGVKPMTQP